MTIKISQLSNMTSTEIDTSTDYLPIVDASTATTAATKRISPDNLVKFVPRSLIFFRAHPSGTIGPGTTQYFHSAGFDAADNTAQMIMPIAGTLRNLYVRTGTAPGGSATYSFTLMKDGSTTTLATTISSSATEASDSSNTVALSAGESLSLRVQSSTDATTSGGGAVGIGGTLEIIGP